MKLSSKLLVTLAFCSFNLAHAATPTPTATNQTITYKNQRGSTMTLIFHPGKNNNTGTLDGTFTTAVGECSKDVGVPLPLSGYYNGNAVAATVSFPHCRAVVAMTGNLLENQNKIQALWLAATWVKDPQKEWNSNFVGADFFTKTN